MSLSAKMRRAPLRAVTGAFILSSGVGKLQADEATSAQLHGMATGTYPFLGKVNPKVFTKGLAAGEVAVGAIVLAPFVSPVIAGAAVAGFSGALLNMYWQTPGMHEPGDPRPTQQGTPLAKDVWMLGIGAGLVVDGLLEPAHDKKLEVRAALGEKKAARGRRARRAKKRAARANSEVVSQARETTLALKADARKRGKKAAKKASQKAQKKADKATKRLAEAREEYGPAAADKANLAGTAVRGWIGEHGPAVAEKARDTAKQARDTAKDLADEYGPVVADKAKQARGAAKDLVDEYGPTVADKAKQARDTAQDLAEEYGPAVADKAKQARGAAKDAAERAQAAVR